MKKGSVIHVATLLLIVSFQAQAQVKKYGVTATELRNHFLRPPANASPWVFWYWMHGAVSKEGITADLEAMKQAGIGGAYLMPIKDTTTPSLIKDPVRQLSPQWWGMVIHSLNEAKRLGLQLGMHVSDGFALAGGPWITPGLSMQKVVWTQQTVTGGKVFHDSLAQPETNEGYYRDIAVFALPAIRGAGLSTQNTIPAITSSKPDSFLHRLIDPSNKQNFNCDEPCRITYEFAKLFTCRSITIRSRNNYQSNRLLIESSNDGIRFQQVTKLESPRHGWQDWDSPYTHSIPQTTARFFRFSYDKDGSEPGAEDLDAAKWKQSLKITGIELSSSPAIHQYQGKNGEVWRISKYTTNEQIPDSVCVPLNKVINLTAKLDPHGRLQWHVPAGEWTILRMGHTSTGHRNETGGAAKGLECDKFNPAAVALQFDKWYGEVLRKAGTSHAGKTLSHFHVDSWECGSQNWSVHFADQFKKRRGYDPLPYLSAMAGIPLQSAETSERFLRDVRQTISELVAEVFFETLKKLSAKYGVAFSAESVAPTMVSDGMLHYKKVDLPMGEFWLNSPTHDKPNDMLDAISAAHVYGKNIVQAEGFTQLRMDWNEHPGMLKTLTDRNFALGINKLFLHVFVHNPWMDRRPGMTLDAIGLYFQRDQTWWKKGKAWMDYIRRCQFMLQAGNPVVDIAVFTGEDLPRRAVLPDRLVPVLPGIFGSDVVERESQRLRNEDLPLRQMPAGVTHSSNMADPDQWTDALRGYAYDSYNQDVLLNHTSIKNKKLQTSGGTAYEVLIIPGMHKMTPNADHMSVEVAQKLHSLAGAGATILYKDFPTLSTGVKDMVKNDSRVREIINSFKGKSFTIGKTPQQVEVTSVGKGRVIQLPYTAENFTALGLAPDITFHEQNNTYASGFAWTHRRGADFDIYFISNQKDSAREVAVSLRVAGRQPEIWDPLTGAITTTTEWRVEKERTIVPLKLESNGSVFIVLKNGTKQRSGKGRNWMTTKPVKEINGSWTVHFDSSGLAKTTLFHTLSDWSRHPDPFICYYSGTATYHQTIEWKGMDAGTEVWLNTGEVSNIAEVFVNGISCGVVWTAPFRTNVSKAMKPGRNEIKIEVTNTWANRLIGDQLLPPGERTTQTTAPFRLAGKPLLKAGLSGPVTLEVTTR